MSEEETTVNLKQRILILQAQLDNLKEGTIVSSMNDMARGYKNLETELNSANSMNKEYIGKLITVNHLNDLNREQMEELVESFHMDSNTDIKDTVLRTMEILTTMKCYSRAIRDIIDIDEI
jgi:hypothetical protein